MGGEKENKKKENKRERTKKGEIEGGGDKDKENG